MSDTKVLEVQNDQREKAKRATQSLLKGKRRAAQEFTVQLETEGGVEEVSFLFRALGGSQWDDLITANPPTKEQRVDGASYNPNTFAPALLALVCQEPRLDEQEWTEIWNGGEWSKGELSELFWGAVGLCNKGLDVNPTERG